MPAFTHTAGVGCRRAMRWFAALRAIAPRLRRAPTIPHASGLNLNIALQYSKVSLTFAPNFKPNECMSNSGIKVFAPATVANVGCGFDILGLAIEQPGDEIIARWSDEPGFRITKITGAKNKLSFVPTENTAGVAALALLADLKNDDLLAGRGINLEVHKKMPFSSGLGSSAASAVGAAMAINELLRRPYTKRELLPFAMAGEELASGARHADNVAPSLLGGLQLVRDNETLDIHRLHTPRGLYVTVVYPHVSVPTKEARAILSKTVSLKSHVTQSANLGALVTGLFTADLDLVSRALQDVIIEPQRAALIPNFYDIQNTALQNGALGCSISGAGPSIFALCPNSFVAENIAAAMKRIYADAKIAHDVFISPINHEGAKLS